MTTIGLEAQRRLTDAFIAQWPITITLVPHTKTRTASGGYTMVAGAPRAPQTVSIVESPPDPTFPVEGTDGRAVRTTYELVAAWDADLGLYDTFEVPGQTGEWKVTQLYFENGWERRAAVEKVG